MTTRNHIALYLFFGFIILSVGAVFFEIPQSAFAAISLSSFFFALAQVGKSYVNYRFDDMKAQLDTYSTTKDINISDMLRLEFKRVLPWIHQNKSVKFLNQLTNAFECGAIIILILGITIPIPVFENKTVKVVSTLLSYACIFLSIWFVEKSAERKDQWENVQMLSLILGQQSEKTVEEDTTHADA